jgi:hypothetical protein
MKVQLSRPPEIPRFFPDLLVLGDELIWRGVT